MKAVIMAGGQGTRLRPLTCHIPKPMVPLEQKPVMEYAIELLKKHGITEIAVTLQYLPEVIKNYFGDGSQFGVELHYFEETTPLGTAGGVKKAEFFLDDRFIVMSGDCITDFDLTKGINFHKEKGALTTIFMKKVESPFEYGVILTNEEAEIVRFLEKPNRDEVFSNTVNTGIYILEPEVFQYLKPEVPTDFSKDLFPILMRAKNLLFGFYADGYWADIGTISSYRQAQLDMKNNKVEVYLAANELYEGSPLGVDNVIKSEKIAKRSYKIYSQTKVTQQNTPYYAKKNQNFTNF